MSHLCSFMELIDNVCKEDSRIEDLLKKIDLLERENTLLQAEYKEHERDNNRLQMELFNVEAMVEPLKQLPADESVETTNMQLMETCTNIRYAISQIDFSKIVQCNHTQMEQNYRKEWQQLQDYTVSMLKWHEKMEQRDVIQRYRKVEKTFIEMELQLQKSQRDNDTSVNQSLSRLSDAKQKLNILILYLIEGNNNLNKSKEIYEHANMLIELRKQKAELLEKCESQQNSTFSSMMPYKNTFCSNKSASDSDVLSTFKYDMPKFPTFSDILKSFNQDLNQSGLVPQITMIENTTNIMVKSILHNSQDNSMEINQSITTQHTKHVHFKMQLDDKFEVTETTNCTISDCSSDDSAGTKIEVPHSPLPNVAKEPEQIQINKEIPIIDLLTPSNNDNVNIEEHRPKHKSDKQKIDILECIVIKPPTTNKANDSETWNKENLSPNLANGSLLRENTLKLKKNNNDTMPPPLKPGASRKKGDKLEKSLYAEFLNTPLSETASDDSSDCPVTSGRAMKDFDSYISAHSEQHEGKNEQHPLIAGGQNNNDVAGKDTDGELRFDRQDFTFDMNGASEADPFAGGNVLDFFS